MAEPQSQLSMWLPPVLAAFSAAGLTAWFSLLRFRKERWWEKKFQSYVAIMEALHNIGAGFDEDLEAAGTGQKISDERRLELTQQYRAGKKEIYKQIDVGRFLLADDTVSSLQKFLRDLDDAGAENDFDSYNGRSSIAVQSCIERTRSIARKDLGAGLFGFRTRI
jgi:hypothetical protein